MKKFFMSLITISITIIIVGSMYLFTSNLKNKSEIKSKDFSNNEVIKNKDYLNEKDKINKSIEENKNIDEKKDNKINEEKINKNEKKAKDNNKESIKENKENTKKENSKSEEEKQEKVFKVNKHTLLKNLPIKDKIKLLYMCKGLSTIDMGNITEYMKSSNELEASIQIFKILRQRLSKEDYNEIKKILNPYVNIDYIENNMEV